MNGPNPLAVTENDALEPLATVTAEGCTVKEGDPLTTTLNVPLTVLPMLSVAVAVTIVVPMANVPPLKGEYARVGVPMLSVAVPPLNVTLAPLADVALTLNVPGTVSTGAVVSTTPPPDSVPLPVPAGRPRAKRKPS